MASAMLSSSMLCQVQGLRASASASAPQRALRLEVSSKTIQSLEGKVVSTKNSKTVIVNVLSRYPHPKYKKMTSSTKKYYVHDEKEEATDGDVVKIEATGRAISKNKRWVLAEICGQKGCDPNQN
eukprot:1177437-Prorocentrum_minimum.AAC.1